jgi:hypothetical protein
MSVNRLGRKKGESVEFDAAADVAAAASAGAGSGADAAQALL